MTIDSVTSLHAMYKKNYKAPLYRTSSAGVHRQLQLQHDVNRQWSHAGLKSSAVLSLRSKQQCRWRNEDVTAGCSLGVRTGRPEATLAKPRVLVRGLNLLVVLEAINLNFERKCVDVI